MDIFQGFCLQLITPFFSKKTLDGCFRKERQRKKESFRKFLNETKIYLFSLFKSSHLWCLNNEDCERVYQRNFFKSCVIQIEMY